MRKLTKHRIAQSTIEFTFAMVMIALLIYGLLRVFRWVGMDYAERSRLHQEFVEPPMESGDFFANEEAQFNTPPYKTKRIGGFTRQF